MEISKLIALVPVYNEEEVIDEFSTRLMSSLEKLVDEFEIIFVVEGDDATLNKLRAFAFGNPSLKLYHSEKRLGLGRAIKKGLALVSEDTDYVLTMDADLNHHPEEIGKLLDAAETADVVVGARLTNHGMVKELPFFKRTISAATNWVLRKAFQIPSGDVTSGFRVYSTRVIQSVRNELTSTNFEITAELLIRSKKKGFSIVEVPITFTPRPRGTSKLSLVRTGIGYAKLLARIRLQDS